MSQSSIVENKNIYFKKILNNLNKKSKINVNHIVLNRNNLNQKLNIRKINENSFQKKIFQKEKIARYDPHFDKVLSISLLNKTKDSLQNQKQNFLKSPLNLLKVVQPPSFHNLGNNNNIPLLPVQIHKINKNPSLNNLRNVEYNSINYIINNFNLSCKNIDSHEDINKKPDNMKQYKKFDFFEKNNRQFQNYINNLKKNNRLSNFDNNNNIKNLSHLSEMNDSNINNVTNAPIKNEEIIMENNLKKEKIKQRHQENKKRMIYLKELEKKNKRLKNDYKEIKIKHMEYSKSLERLMKFLRVLKNSGLDINERMDNISSGEDYDEYVEDDIEESDNSEQDCEGEKNETILSDGSVLSNLKQLSSGLLRNHEEYTKGSKLILKFKNIPLLKLYKIKKNNGIV